MLLSQDVVRRSAVGKLLEEHDSLMQDLKSDRNMIYLALALLHFHGQGHESFFHPYIQTLPRVLGNGHHK